MAGCVLNAHIYVAEFAGRHNIRDKDTIDQMRKSPGKTAEREEGPTRNLLICVEGKAQLSLGCYSM